MARVKYGGIISEISGSVGGFTFQKSLYGNTLRNKPIPFAKRSSSQINVRSILSYLHLQWRTLTSAQRTQWNQFISFSGQTIRRDSGVLLTGHDLFIKYNMFRRLNSQAILSVPTYISMPTVPLYFTVNLSGADLYLSFSDAVDKDAIWFIFRVTAVRPPARSFSEHGLRFLYIVPADDSDFDISTQYTAAFGVLPLEGQVVHIAVQYYSVLAPVYLAPVKKTWPVEQSL